MTRPAGDDPNSGNTECSAVTQDENGLCLENHYVSNETCVPCLDELTRPAGDDPNSGNTECSEPEMICVCPIENQYRPMPASGARINFKEPRTKCRSKSSSLSDNEPYDWYSDPRTIHCLKQDKNTCEDDSNRNYCSWILLSDISPDDYYEYHYMQQNPRRINDGGRATEHDHNPQCYHPTAFKVDYCSQYEEREMCNNDDECSWDSAVRGGHFSCLPNEDYRADINEGVPNHDHYKEVQNYTGRGFWRNVSNLKTPNYCCANERNKNTCFPREPSFWNTSATVSSNNWHHNNEPDYEPARCCRGFEL